MCDVSPVWSTGRVKAIYVNGYIERENRLHTIIYRFKMIFKGQMNQKIDIFSFVALHSPNTKKNHPKWDLGKDFSSQAFIER